MASNRDQTDPTSRGIEQRFRLLAEIVKDHGIFTLDVEGYITSWNAGAERVNGYSAAEIIGQHFSIFYPAKDVKAGKCELELEVASKKGRFEDEGFRIRKDGSKFWANVIITALRGEDGRLLGFAKGTRDLTDRIRAEEERLRRMAAEDENNRRGTELRASEVRLRLLIESVSDYAIFMLDTSGHIASWNAGAERIKGYSTKEIVGKHFSIFYVPEESGAGKCEMELEVAAKEGRFEDEGFRVRKDGTRFWANVVITAVRDSTGQLVGFGKVTRDLTARVVAEEERVRLARAEEGERRKEEFLAIMGHELRNPLAPMVTAVHLIKARRGLNCTKEIAVLERQLSQMMRLLDDLLDVTRALRDGVTLSPEPIGIADVLANAVDVASPRIEEKHHRLHVEVPSEPLVVKVDSARMAQVFANLLNNAAKYTDEGGDIRLIVRGTVDEVEVIVEDTGMGIAPDLMPNIFDLFTQGKQGIDRQLGGLGIGLAVARRLVVDHGGRPSAESEGVGRGSRFTVALPRVREAVSNRDVHSHPGRKNVGRRRVLVVDDNVDSNDMMREFLETRGHEVRLASDGRRALEIVREFSPQVAFLDIGLPGMNGFELARRLRKIPECATIPIVAVSGYARAVDREQSQKAGFSDHIAKPIDLARLDAILSSAE